VFHVALYQPEIPPNTGNIIRLCANTGAQLHLIHPLGFAPHDKKLERAGLDYHAWTQIRHHENFPAFMQYMGTKRIFACSTKGVRHYNDVAFEDRRTFGELGAGTNYQIAYGAAITQFKSFQCGCRRSL
jgi:tRNA (cytidine/uridine-2'-O-)-methyltransferase